MLNDLFYLHFKFEFLTLFKIIMHNKFLHKVWVQVIPYDFCSTNLQNIKSYN